MYIKQIIIVLFSCYLVACATTDEDPSEAAASENSNRSDCISQSAIRDYRVLDDANLIVTEGASRKYHVELSRRAHGLRSSRHVGFQSQSGRICGRFDDLMFDTGLGMEKVRIGSIRRLTPEQEEDILIRFGLLEPEIEQPRVPQDVEGAEVEELD